MRECSEEQWAARREQQGGTLRSTYLPDAVTYQAEERSWATPRAIYGEHPGMTDERHLTGQAQRTWGTPTQVNTGNWGRDLLKGQVEKATYPTPAARDGDQRGAQDPEKRREGGHSIGLDDAVHGGSTQPTSTPEEPLTAANHGSLNPTWVEWLMGWPRGWTVCGPSVTDKSLKLWLRRSRTWLERLGY